MQNITTEKINSMDTESKDVLHQTISMANYNLAVEYEHCKDYDSATETFLKS